MAVSSWKMYPTRWIWGFEDEHDRLKNPIDWGGWRKKRKKTHVATRGLPGRCAPPPTSPSFHVFSVFAHAGFNPETRGREIQ